jgi:hypothetical protein
LGQRLSRKAPDPLRSSSNAIALSGRVIALAGEFDSAYTNPSVHYGRWIGLQLRSFARGGRAMTGRNFKSRLVLCTEQKHASQRAPRTCAVLLILPQVSLRCREQGPRPILYTHLVGKTTLPRRPGRARRKAIVISVSY